MTHITFDEVRIRGEKRVKCGGCGKPLRRSATFYQTISPFNRGRHGVPKSRDEIMAELKAERAKWMKEPVYCGTPCVAKEARR